MDVTALGHASYLVSCEEGPSILIDPVLGESHQEGLFCHYPQRIILAENLLPPDIIAVSHRHMDHFDVDSLKQFDSRTPIIIPHDPLLRQALTRAGFDNLMPLSAGEAIRAERFCVTATPSMGAVPEIGFLIESGQHCVWNQVDTIVNQDVCRAIAQTRAPDLAFVRWQPLQDGLPSGSGSITFPTLEYAESLRALLPLNASAVALGACGFRYCGALAWLNHVVFPQSRTRALNDFSTFLGVDAHASDPGTVFSIRHGKVAVRPNCSMIAASLGQWSERDFAVCPWRADWPRAKPGIGRNAHIADLRRRLRAWIKDCPDDVALLRDWGVLYHLRVHAGGVAYDLTIDFRESKPLFGKDYPDDASLTCFVDVQTVANLAAAEITWDSALLGGEIFQHARIYCVERGIIRLPSDTMLPDPLFAGLGTDGLWLRAQF